MKKLFFCFALLAFYVLVSCSSENRTVPGIVNKIEQLPEYKRAELRIDSLQAAGRDVELQIAIIEDSPFEDSTKNVSLAIIEESYSFDEIPLFQVRFDKVTQEIISIESMK